MGEMGAWLVVWEDKEGGLEENDVGVVGSGGAYGNADCLFELFCQARL